MNTTITEEKRGIILSEMAENLIGSEIITLPNEAKERIRNGEKIFNLTISDFDPNIFPIPEEFKNEIIAAYNSGQTNYPAPNGIRDLRRAVSHFLRTMSGLEYTEDEILISGGGRPLIYAVYQAILDPGDSVIFPVPSWNNNHYCHLTRAKQIPVETKPENNFMPTADEIKPHIREANLIALCSPLNPTGTTFSKEALQKICNLILEENKRRGNHKKPLYLLFDRIYSLLTYGETQHHDPVTLCPELKDYTIFIDGMSKSFAATGVRVGWSFGTAGMINKMKAILSHVGAWSPKAEQVAAANYLKQESNIGLFLSKFKNRIQKRLDAFYNGFQALKKEGFNVDAVAPQAALYLAVKLDIQGLTTKDATQYILDEAKIALVPFYAFGADKNSRWYRLSVGTASMDDIDSFFGNLRNALSKFS